MGRRISLEKAKNKKLIIALISAFFVTIFISINLDVNTPGHFIEANHIFYIILVGLYIGLFYKTMEIKDKRACICSGILALLFSSFEVIGYSVHQYGDLSGVLGSPIILLKAFFKWIGYVATFYALVYFLFTQVLSKWKTRQKREYRFFKNNTVSFVLTTMILLLAYLPYFLTQFPGSYSIDSISEMSSALYSMDNLINHHPVFHIWIISICLNIGRALGGLTAGIAIYSIFQMLFTAITFSFMLYYMAKKGVSVWIRVLTLIFVAFYPPFAFYSITMWKDVPFALALVWFIIALFEMTCYQQNFFKSWKWQVLLIISSLLVILFRNNGIYVILFTIPFLIFFAKGNRKKVSILSVGLIAFYLLLKGPIFNVLHIQDGPPREALSVPLQQIARTVKYKEEELTQRQKEVIYRYLPVDNIGEKYYPLISDSVKDQFNNELFQENKGDFFKVWFELLLKYPRIYIESFLAGSSGYWYPEEINWIIPDWIEYENAPLEFQQSKKPIITLQTLEILQTRVNKRDIPIISMFFSIGFAVWTVLFLVIYAIYRKKYQLLLIFIPILALWLTTMASPVWCEYRYIYGLFTTLPFLFIMTLWKGKQEKSQEEEENEN